MKDTIRLIVNADDYGLSAGVNRGIEQCFEQGILRSASLMVRQSAARQAAEYAKAHPGLSVGLHLDLGEWECRDGQWRPRYEVVSFNDASAVAAEIERQLEAFRDLMGTNPTHLDSHQHVHRKEPVRAVMGNLSRSLGVTLRSFDSRVVHCGSFYGQTGEGDPMPDWISVENLIKLLDGMPPGICEMGCHPGLDAELDSVYRDERRIEVASLCDPKTLAAVERAGIQLCSFEDI